MTDQEILDLFKIMSNDKIFLETFEAGYQSQSFDNLTFRQICLGFYVHGMLREKRIGSFTFARTEGKLHS